MEIVEKKVSDLIPYENNPRIISEESVNAVAASFEAFGILQPLVIDTHNVVIAGHTRLLAAKQLGLETVPCKIADELSDDEANAYRIADNSTGELSAWDYAKRDSEISKLKNFDMATFGIQDFDKVESLEEDEEIQDERYTNKIDKVQYTPSEDGADLSDCYSTKKTDELISEIEASNVTDEEKLFLIQAAHRHSEFIYKKIADYYASASAEMQELMEKSGLVIIDMDDAIANGYVELSKRLESLIAS